MEYNFEWDINKARTNFRKHKISFTRATTVFRDPLAISIIDHTHDDTEEHWLTLGQADNGHLLVVVHTFHESSDSTVKIRIISARKASQSELRQYELTQ